MSSVKEDVLNSHIIASSFSCKLTHQCQVTDQAFRHAVGSVCFRHGRLPAQLASRALDELGDHANPFSNSMSNSSSFIRNVYMEGWVFDGSRG